MNNVQYFYTWKKVFAYTIGFAFYLYVCTILKIVSSNNKLLKKSSLRPKKELETSYWTPYWYRLPNIYLHQERLLVTQICFQAKKFTCVINYSKMKI